MSKLMIYENFIIQINLFFDEDSELYNKLWSIRRIFICYDHNKIYFLRKKIITNIFLI
jgi:hypothetical protein